MLTEAIENLLNRNLGSSPRARESCAALKGRRLKLVIRDLDLQIGFESVGDSLRISRQTAGEFDAEVEGTSINLLALVSPQPERLLKSGTVQVRGDVELLQRYRELALLLRPDLEEELAKLIGDSPAHRLAGLAKAALAFGRRGASTAVQNAAEYFAHETRDLVPRAEAEVFLGEVDRLREDVDRAAARVEALLARFEQPANDGDRV
ncbi:MAG: SCP2 domain-containing protein [Gammaproteobacteria bacterium]